MEIRTVKNCFVFNLLGGIKKVVGTIDVREGKLNLYNDSFVWEGNYLLCFKLSEHSDICICANGCSTVR